MENIFAKRRARLLAMKAMRENYVPGEKLVTCPHCGGESQRKDVAEALSVCPLVFPVPRRAALRALFMGAARKADGQ